MTGSEERLVKFLSAAGVASRRAAGDLVKAGRIAVNGRTIREPGFRILPADTVTLDGRPVEPAGRFHYIMLNKPRGYVCTNADPHAPRKAVDLIRLDPPVRLFSAGRLDKESEGMILFSNDGDYVARLTHPRYEIRKTYLVRVTREFTEPELTRIRTGITDGGEHLRVISIAPAGNCLYRIVLNEGKKREIRRLTAAVGSPTLELRRIRIGGLALGDLPQGAFRELTPEEVALTLEAHS
ncbi:pseudouridine synthase [Victivallales bacterium CCUG 44730]|uniref:pseudouridine synthase n=1 Tax=uncultured Victivallis sp. TaxID=354118 RepID=UPI000D046087|nr:pseudouridine synthase [uncultured Victivallis sp.]AVM45496.1 pseudouridine synthase [Victivallales bacterium CCUG 44730]